MGIMMRDDPFLQYEGFPPILGLLAKDDAMRASLNLLHSPERWSRFQLGCRIRNLDGPNLLCNKELGEPRTYAGILLARDLRVVRHIGNGQVMSVPMFYMRDLEEMFAFNCSSDAYYTEYISAPAGHEIAFNAWHDPEVLPDAHEMDAELGRNEFYVYVLRTDFGHYVGHTCDVTRRINEHQNGGVQSTAGSNPELVWTSKKLSTRDQAIGLEARLKKYQEWYPERYQREVGLEARSFYPNRRFTDIDKILWELFEFPDFIATRPVVEICVYSKRNAYQDHVMDVNWITDREVIKGAPLSANTE